MSRRRGETVTVVRTTEGGEDDWGDPTPGVEVRIPIERAAVAPLKTGEDATTDGVRLIDGFTLYLPPGSDVLASDAVEVRGGLYRVDGTPGVWESPYAGKAPRGVEVIVKRS